VIEKLSGEHCEPSNVVYGQDKSESCEQIHFPAVFYLRTACLEMGLQHMEFYHFPG
jgi:hypothetical protein